jgi:uncharacterized membrane protein
LEDEEGQAVEGGPSEGESGPEHLPSSRSWAESLDAYDYEGDSESQKLFKIFFPFAVPAAIFSFLFYTMGYVEWLQGLGFSMWQMAGLIFMVDVVCAMFISWNFPVAKKIPLIGHLLAWIERKGAQILGKHPGLTAGAWISMVLFVMVPFQGSGGVTASIIGRVIGMRSSYIISAVATGALIAGVIIGTIAEIGWGALQDDLVTGIILILVGVQVALTAILVYRLHMMRKWERMAS